ncbi:hypothetical protein NC653_004453 [Populus alba x Populus x berolinensis]|uniref:Uncharacterized protein n=1 Tax=Populus alba x Populus x berolinensis TaxID=444605 RepID=A0AAD6RWK1_9ROSI|nr:hypothetical protein NC653_004453 [Populus alba x Populus x berolinensis]
MLSFGAIKTLRHLKNIKRVSENFTAI